MKKYSIFIGLVIANLVFSQTKSMDLNQAKTLLQLPLNCIETEYPNKLGQVLTSDKDLGSPKELHPSFYGCFDWHSAVHGYWSIVTILQLFPELDVDDEIKKLLLTNLSKENIAKEIDYFEKKESYSYERTYGWAWLFKLQESLDTWDTPIGRDLSENLKPLTNILENRFIEYLPKLHYPIRVGTHTNTAFAMSLVYDYAQTSHNAKLKSIIRIRAKELYFNDKKGPLSWEPSGYDFLSPCLQEVDLMRKVLPKKSFLNWLNQFLPELNEDNFQLAVGEVTDRTDGHLVHLDGVNFSRAWVLYDLIAQYPQYQHLKTTADEHYNYSYPNIFGDHYEGGHWLGTFALYCSIKKDKIN